MAKKVLMATIVLLALSIMISQGACVDTILPGQPRNIPAIVSTNWLRGNLHRKNLVVLDVRSADAYTAGHIPGAINVPEADWYVNDPFTVPIDTPWMELPLEEELIDLIENAGIKADSLVVVVGSTSGLLDPLLPLALYNTAGITRVAITLLYAGVRNVAILDGGYDKWEMEGKPTTTEPTIPTPVPYTGSVDETMLVSADDVEGKIGESVIVDARDEIVYNGTVTEPWAPDPGHILTARNLPTPQLWNIEEDGAGNAVYITYKDMGSLKRMIFSEVGNNKKKETIVYCGVGGYASTAYFVLSEVLGYRNVRIYDGSAQEWNGILGKPLVT